jgi:putative transposase
VIGAEPYERTATRTVERDGHRDRVLSTKAGDVELRIPKLRRGSFFPSILEPRRRIDQAPYAVVMSAYVNGVSTRSVDDLVAALDVDTGISKSEVSRICKRLNEHVDAFRNRPLGHIAFPYVYLDATHVNVRDTALGQVVSKAIVIATGTPPEATAKSSASPLVTRSPKRSGASSAGACGAAVSAGSDSSSPTPTKA